MDMEPIGKEEFSAFDDVLAASLVEDDYYPDWLALTVYARATETHLPLSGDAYLAFRDTLEYRKRYGELSPEQRASLVLEEWNREYPDRIVSDPFLSGTALTN